MLINITIPVFNEEDRLARSIPRLHRFLSEHCRFDFELVVGDNGSTDCTLEIAWALSRQYVGCRVVHLDEKGRGRALKHVWSASHADVLTYMDVDLSTDLSAFPSLIEALLSGGYDLAVGSRLLNGSVVIRGLKREIISRCYNTLIKVFFGATFSDAQCEFKAIKREAATRLVPLVEDNGWFMDTELLILAEKIGYLIFDLPVRWTEDADSRVRIWRTAMADLKGLARLRRQLPTHIRNHSQTASITTRTVD